MSEVDARPASTRGRGSRGRGGFSGRGASRSHNASRKPANGTSSAIEAPHVVDQESLAEQGELGEMKKKYASEVTMLKDMFPDWTDVDLVFALQETDGDLPSTVEKITAGNVSQFAEVKKNKDRARSKVAKDEAPATGTADKPAARGGRGRGGLESSRGGRGRGNDRGRGGSRGGRGGHTITNGTQKESFSTSIPTTESSAWDTTAAVENTDKSWDTTLATAKDTADDAAQSSWGNVVTAEATPAAASEGMKSSLIPEGGSKKSWASMFAQEKLARNAASAKQSSGGRTLPAELAAMELVPGSIGTATEQTIEQESVAQPALQEEPVSVNESEQFLLGTQDALGEPVMASSQAPLTEENVENLPDKSHPPATETVVSNAGSVDTRNLTPLASQSAPIGRPPVGGFAATAYRATGMPGRSASYQRKVQEQLEAVVMPGHNAGDRAAVQFGSMGLNGEPGPDVDDDREEPETRHAPQPSPPSQPRTSLPSAPRQAVPTQEAPDGLPTPKQAPGLPPASTQNQQQMQEQNAPPGMTQQDQSQMSSNYNQYRYGQPGMHQDSSGQQQKPYDPFAHQAQPSHFDQYNGHAHAQQAPQQPQNQSVSGGHTAAPNNYSSYYTSDHSRNAYNQYYGSYNHQDDRGPVGQSQQDAGLGQQRSASGVPTMPTELAWQEHKLQTMPSHFGENPGSGHNTPNPPMGGQQQPGPTQQHSQQGMHQAQALQHQQGGYPPGASAAYPYGHPYYSSPYQTAYQNQFGYSHPSNAYGGGYQGKQPGGMYGTPLGYGQSSYDQHPASPANTGAYNSNQQASMRSVSGLSTGLGAGPDEYGRASAQSGSHQQSSGFGSANDPFARSTSGFGGQGGYGHQMHAGGPEDSLKPFPDTKSGPSPALGQPGRPSSAANSAVGSSQSGLPPPQSQQQSGFSSGYPGFSGQTSQYGGLGGFGNNHQQSQQGQQGQGGYSQYGANFNQSYGGYGSQQQRGGWGTNYGAH